MITSGGGIATSHMKNRITKKKMVWVRVRLRDVLAPANKEGTDHAKEKQAPL
ncbi:hypothetical protein [Clostridioides difficile]|uniref:hypothetical protein n=1 Tax=Clostridioides difficile TaxID=1496 RepID=UPI002E18FB10|nr:hypothetical protein [Clostridioides difficile]